MTYKVLIIEDDLAYKPLWADILNKNISDHDTDICWAVSAEEAKVEYEKSLANQDFFDFIIADVFLAGAETGLDFVDDIFRKNQEAPPVILISSVEASGVEEFVLDDSHRVEVLSKPINQDRFKDVFQRLTGKSAESKSAANKSKDDVSL